MKWAALLLLLLFSIFQTYVLADTYQALICQRSANVILQDMVLDKTEYIWSEPTEDGGRLIKVGSFPERIYSAQCIERNQDAIGGR